MPYKAAADFHLTIEGVQYPFFLATDENGNKQWNDGVAEMVTSQFRTGVFGYEHIPPDIEVIEPFESYIAGCGHEGADSGMSGFYNYTRGIDRSYGGLSLLSLKRNAVLTDTGGAIAATPTGFLVCSLGLFMWAAASIYQFDLVTSAWVLRESGGGTNYTQLLELDSVIYAFRGAGVAYKYSTNGSTWTTFTDAASYFKYGGVRGNGTDIWALWAVATNVMQTTTDGKNAGVAWAGSDEIGHTGEIPQSVAVVDNDIYVFKKSGFARYDGQISESLYETQYFDDSNGKGAYVHDDGCIYVPYNGQLLRFDPYATQTNPLTTVFPAPGMDSAEVRGTVTAIGGGVDGLRIAVKNQDGNSYILRGVLLGDQRVWHTVMYLGANDCNAIKVVGPGVIHATSPGLLLGYGVAAQFVRLPRNGLRPDNDGNCLFDTTEGIAFDSYVPFGAKSFPKFLNRASVLGFNMSTSRYATLKYETDHSGLQTTLVSATYDGLTEANELSEVSFHLIRGVTYMATGDNTVTPVVQAAAFFATENPRRKRTWKPVVILSDEALSRNGVNLDEVPIADDIRRALFSSLTKRVVLTDRSGFTYRVRLLDIQPAGLHEHTQGGIERDGSLYQLLLVEITALTTDELVAVYDISAYDSAAVYA